ncbi:MAG: hypothetical protein CMM53_03675 [Rhodospirillaceae bacterium]|nr:hypothetical protein [Rhodospirillaceae bacterium]|tara:strand:- start:78 stop:368 length:291 start_codon:yes stop_codon:yes gene_type:complete
MKFYNVVMDDRRNPLRALPKAQRFQIMTFLSVMWSTIFCFAIGAWFWWGALVVGHVAIVLGTIMTSITFRQVQKQTHRDLYQAKDGSVRYDDIWGA